MSIKKCMKCYPVLCKCGLTPKEIISSREYNIRSNLWNSEEIAEMEEEIKEAKHQLELTGRKTIKAKMKNNLIDLYLEIMPKEYDKEVGAFLKEINGKVVTLIFTGNDAFEIIDDNIWLPNELWDEIKE